jgi:hypothetical protein
MKTIFFVVAAVLLQQPQRPAPPAPACNIPSVDQVCDQNNCRAMYVRTGAVYTIESLSVRIRQAGGYVNDTIIDIRVPGYEETISFPPGIRNPFIFRACGKEVTVTLDQTGDGSEFFIRISTW